MTLVGTLARPYWTRVVPHLDRLNSLLPDGVTAPVFAKQVVVHCVTGMTASGAVMNTCRSLTSLAETFRVSEESPEPGSFR
jgi:hypothetical protein